MRQRKVKGRQNPAVKKVGIAVTVVVLVCSAGAVPASGGDFRWGRDLEGQNSFLFGFTAGRISELEGEVQETTRPYYEQIGQDTPGENFSISDFGLDEHIEIFGFILEQKWTVVTLGLKASYFHPEAESTATRDYYIGVGEEVEYQGQEYEYMVIPEGQDFEAEIEGGLCELDLLITPFTFKPSPYFQLVPSLYLGIFGLFGHYDLDAGPPTGTRTYENPSRDYVIGGETEGWAGLGVPGLGAAGEIRIGKAGGFQLVVRGQWAFFEYDGSTEYIPVSLRHEKDLDLSYDNYEVEVLAEIPLSEGLDLQVGVAYKHIKADASVTAQERSEEEIEELREKYDKEIDFELDYLLGLAGLRF